MFKQYEVVRTTKLLTGEGRKILEPGTEGTIVDIYKNGKDVGYHVEFTDDDGRTTALLMLETEDIESTQKPPVSARNVVAIRPGSVTSINRKTAAVAARAGAIRAGKKVASGKTSGPSRKAATKSNSGKNRAAVKPGKTAGNARKLQVSDQG